MRSVDENAQGRTRAWTIQARQQEGFQEAALADASLPPQVSATTRGRVLDFVAQHPGACIADVSAALACSHTTATYHLAGLVKKRLVLQRKEGRIVRHFCVGNETLQAMLVNLLEDARRRAIVDKLVEAPGWPVNQLARAAQVNHAFLTRTLRVMTDQGFAVLVRPRARYYVRATPALQDAVREHRNASAPPVEVGLKPAVEVGLKPASFERAQP